MLLAMRLYELKHLSSGQAAELAGVSKRTFIESMGKYGVAIFDVTQEELQRDITNAAASQR